MFDGQGEVAVGEVLVRKLIEVLGDVGQGGGAVVEAVSTGGFEHDFAGGLAKGQNALGTSGRDSGRVGFEPERFVSIGVEFTHGDQGGGEVDQGNDGTFGVNSQAAGGSENRACEDPRQRPADFGEGGGITIAGRGQPVFEWYFVQDVVLDVADVDGQRITGGG